MGSRELPHCRQIRKIQVVVKQGLSNSIAAGLSTVFGTLPVNASVRHNIKPP